MSCNFVPGILLAHKSNNAFNGKGMTLDRSIDLQSGQRIVYSSMVGQEIIMGLEILMILCKESWVLRMQLYVKYLWIFNSPLVRNTEQVRTIFKHTGLCPMTGIVWCSIPLEKWKEKGYESQSLNVVYFMNKQYIHKVPKFWKVLEDV